MNPVTHAAVKKPKRGKAIKRTGPSHFEVEFLRQVKEELELFLRSREFNTIKEIEIEYVGSDYFGQMRVTA